MLCGYFPGNKISQVVGKIVIDYFRRANDIHWGNSWYQWLFFLGILLVLIFDKQKKTRIVFGWVPLVYLFCVFNPLFLKLLEITGANNYQYLVRMFSFMPLMYTIARGFSIAISKLKGFVKLLVTGMLCLVFIFAGNSIFNQPWYKPADNYAKVPQDAQELAEWIDSLQEENVSVAAFEPVSFYLRQVRDVITPYGRDIGTLGMILGADSPDVPYAIQLAGEQDMDYVVARRTESSMQAFEAAGYTPCALTTNLAIYRTQGVNRVRRTWNDKRQLTSLTTYDMQGKPVPRAEGYTTVAYKYDSNGYCIAESYLDANGKPFETDAGYAAIQRICSETGLVLWQSYLNRAALPVLIEGRISTRFEYDLFGRLTRESYYDMDGNPMNRTDTGYAAYIVAYNIAGKVIRERYQDVKGELVFAPVGFAECLREYDDRQNMVCEKFVGTADHPRSVENGYDEIRREYNDDNRAICMRYYLNDRPVMVNGVAITALGYDDKGNVTDEAYFDVDGQPVLHKVYGYHRVKRTYHDETHLSSEAWFNVDDQPMGLGESFASYDCDYDENMNQVTVRIYDADGNRIADIHREFNALNQAFRIWYSIDDVPISLDGIGIIERGYDEAGNIAEEAFFDEKGRPILHPVYHYHRVKKTYLDATHVTSEAWFDLEDQPMTAGDSFVRYECEYDGNLNPIAVRTFGADGNKIARYEGYDELIRDYDDRNRPIRMRYLLNGKPVAINGAAVIEWSYDEVGNIIREDRLDAEGNPVQSL